MAKFSSVKIFIPALLVNLPLSGELVWQYEGDAGMNGYMCSRLMHTLLPHYPIKNQKVHVVQRTASQHRSEFWLPVTCALFFNHNCECKT